MTVDATTFLRVALPRPFYLAPPCVGVRFSSEIASRRVVVVVPPGCVEHTGLLDQQQLEPSGLADLWRAARAAPDSLERTARTADGQPIYGSGVYTRWLLVVGDGRDALATLAVEVETWLAVVSSWIEVYTAQDLASVNPWFDAKVRGRTIEAFDADANPIATRTGMTLTVRDEIAASPAVFAHALKSAAHQDPPLSQILLRSAAGWLMRARDDRAGYRRAVLDAASAAETALSPLVGPAGRLTLGGLLAEAVKKGLLTEDQRKQLQSELVELRNAAIHRGTVGDQPYLRTHRALLAATWLVSRFAPLPEL